MHCIRLLIVTIPPRLLTFDTSLTNFVRPNRLIYSGRVYSLNNCSPIWLRLLNYL